MRKHEAHQSEATYSDIKTHLADFMRDFYEQTEDSACGRARFAESEGAAERPPVLVQVKPFGAAVVLSHVLILDKAQQGKGYGSATLRWLCGLADKHGVAIKGRAQRIRSAFAQHGYPPSGLPTAQLKAWYRRHGFIISRSGDRTRTAMRPESKTA